MRVDPSTPSVPRCPSCGLSPYESGIGDTDISRIVAEHNTLTQERDDAIAAVVSERVERRRLEAALEEIAQERFGAMPDGSTPSAFAQKALKVT